MERRITKQVRNYQSRMKDDIRTWLQKYESGNPNLGKLLEFIYDYPSLEFSKEDFEKRRRIKNQVPIADRCTAKRANGEQCTRRKKMHVSIVEHMQRALLMVQWLILLQLLLQKMWNYGCKR